jgi:hypothetical protein
MKVTPKFHIEIKGKNENAIRFFLKKEAAYLSFEEVFDLWSNSVDFINFYVNALIDLNYQAFYWEHPALNKQFLKKKYECILHRSQPLEFLRSNEKAFEHYLYSKKHVEDFLNLGKNARLIIPTKQTNQEIYNHFGKFIRFAKKEQQLELFKRIGTLIIEELEEKELIWLNTAGLGVIWLHIRLDTRPKYYKTQKYKNPAFLNQI